MASVYEGETLSEEEAKQFYTPGEVAKLFGVTPKTVSNWCDQGRLEYITTPTGHRRIPVSAIKGGRDYDKQLDTVKSRLSKKNSTVPVPGGEAIAAEVKGRRDSRKSVKSVN